MSLSFYQRDLDAGSNVRQTNMYENWKEIAQCRETAGGESPRTRVIGDTYYCSSITKG
jgi:hypothetical protein